MHDLVLRNPQALSVDNVAAYTHWVNQIPMLTEAEEQELTQRLRHHNDLEAARKLVLSHLRLVVKIARHYAGYGLNQADLIQEGNIGLMKAVKRFDPNVGVRLVSFAIHWIRAEIHDFIVRNWRIVKIATTKAQRKLFFNLRKVAKQRSWFSDEEVDTVASMLNVSKADVREMEARLSHYDEALEPTDETDAEDPASWQSPIHTLQDQHANPERQLEQDDWESRQKQCLQQALASLDERSQDILQQRWLAENKATLQDLAAKYQISAERVRQLENNAMKKLRKAFA